MKVAIIADDLTGANATAALLSTQGFTTLTCLDNPEYAEDYDVVSFSTDSRSVSYQEAYALCGGIWGQKWMRLLTGFRN